MTEDERREVQRIIEAHEHTVAVCRACAETTRDLAWDMALRAGRADPAPCAPVAPGDPAYVGSDEVAVIDVPGHDSLLGRAVSALADRVPVDLTGARP